MSRCLRYFRPGVNLVLGAVLLASAAAVVASGVSAVHGARRASLEVCEARLEALEVRNPAYRGWTRPRDPCDALKVFADHPRSPRSVGFRVRP